VAALTSQTLLRDPLACCEEEGKAAKKRVKIEPEFSGESLNLLPFTLCPAGNWALPGLSSSQRTSGRREDNV
jgi:hypothetical protein